MQFRSTEAQLQGYRTEMRELLKLAAEALDQVLRTNPELDPYPAQDALQTLGIIQGYLEKSEEG